MAQATYSTGYDDLEEPRTRLASAQTNLMEMRICLLTVALLVVPLVTFAQTRETDPEECSSVATGTSVRHRTNTVSNRTSTARAYAVVALQRDANDQDAKSCLVTYSLFVNQYSRGWRQVKQHIERRSDIVGVTLVGFSPDGTRVAADFWWADGDYTAVRPVIFNLVTSTVQMRELSEQITNRLPSCDYFQSFERITNSGESVIHVPKSHYVDVGCPDQGDWLFNLKTGMVRRVKSALNRVRLLLTATPLTDVQVAAISVEIRVGQQRQ